MRLDRLPRGISGAVERADEPVMVDPAEFKRACYSVAQMLRGSVEITELAPLYRSYYLANVITRWANFAVLGNRMYPYVAFAPVSFDWQQHLVDFVESVEFASAFSAVTVFHPLDADWLQSELAPEQVRDLSPAELKELRHWGPRRVGDVIFNFWD